MFEPILDSIIEGTAKYEFNFDQLIVNNKLSYVINNEMEILSISETRGNNPSIKYTYYKVLDTNQIKYNKFTFNSKEEVLLPALDADKDEIFNFNLMYQDHSSVLAEKIEKSFGILKDEYKKGNDNIEFDISAMMKNAGM